MQCFIERAAVGVEPVGEHVDRDAVDGESDKDAPLVRCERGDSVLQRGEQFRLFGGVGGAEAGAREEIPAFLLERDFAALPGAFAQLHGSLEERELVDPG